MTLHGFYRGLAGSTRSAHRSRNEGSAPMSDEGGVGSTSSGLLPAMPVCDRHGRVLIPTVWVALARLVAQRAEDGSSEWELARLVLEASER